MKSLRYENNMEQRHPIQKFLDRVIRQKLDEIPFIIFVSFLLTFIVARAYVYITFHDVLELPIKFVYVRGIHVHHLNFGIFILVIVGFVSLYDLRPSLHQKLAVLYGIGLALTFDEFALWLKLQDDYYARISYDAIIMIAVILLNIIYFPDFWRRMGKRIVAFVRFILPK